MAAPVMGVAEAAAAMMPMKRKVVSLLVAGGPSGRSRLIGQPTPAAISARLGVYASRRGGSAGRLE
jgi:hypothetical protein